LQSEFFRTNKELQWPLILGGEISMKLKSLIQNFVVLTFGVMMLVAAKPMLTAEKPTVNK